MLKQYLNKGISTPLALFVIIILASIVGAFTLWQYSEIQKKETNLPEVKIPDKRKILEKEVTSTQPEESTSTEEIDTSDWETYRNEEFGFEIKYPSNIFRIEEGQHPKYHRKNIFFISSGYLGLLITKEEKEIHGVPVDSIHSLEELEKVLRKGKNLDFGMVVTSNIKFDRAVVGNQYQALQVGWETTKVEGRDLYILLTNGTPKVIIISVEWRLPEDRPIVEKMISTVKFLYK